MGALWRSRMSRNKHFEVEFVLVDAAGKPSDLYYDLRIDREKRKRYFDRLTDDFLYTKEELPWRIGPEGRWILIQLHKDIALCQWDPGNETLWALGFKVGKLKVMRIVRKADTPAILAAYAPSESDE
jgi:hypothetical protein